MPKLAETIHKIAVPAGVTVTVTPAGTGILWMVSASFDIHAPQ